MLDQTSTIVTIQTVDANFYEECTGVIQTLFQHNYCNDNWPFTLQAHFCERFESDEREKKAPKCQTVSQFRMCISIRKIVCMC